MRVLLAANMTEGVYWRKLRPDLAIDRIVTPGTGVRSVTGLAVTAVYVAPFAAIPRGFTEVYEGLRRELVRSGNRDAVEWVREHGDYDPDYDTDLCGQI